MKKLYFAVFLVCLSLKISAQNYFPMLDSVNEWHSITNVIPVRLSGLQSTASAPCSYPEFYLSDQSVYTGSDSVVSSQTYKTVYELNDMSPPACFLGFIREDTAARKVYFKDNLSNSEVLLYDFSMIPGNTINVNVQGAGYFSSGTFTLDSIRTIHINAGNRRIFYLRNHAASANLLVWIESMGCTVNPFYPVCMNEQGYNQFFSCTSFAHDAIEYVTCFDHTSKVYYDSCAYHQALINSCFQVSDTCNYHDICGGINELQAGFSFELFPVPSSGKTFITISAEEQAAFFLSVYDYSGKLLWSDAGLGIISPGKTEKSIDLSGLTSGIYILELKSGERSVHRKIVLE